jgi:hypothetical protein
MTANEWADPAYWIDRVRRDVGRPSLVPLRKHCVDCAVKCGLYTEVAAGLAQQPDNIKSASLAKWFCHNAPDRGCAGAREAMI